MLHPANKGGHPSGPLNRCSVEPDSYMGAAWKPKIDPLSHQRRSTSDSRRDQIKGGRMRSWRLRDVRCSFNGRSSQATEGDLKGKFNYVHRLCEYESTFAVLTYWN